MKLPNIFTFEVSQEVIERINKLTPESQAQWGKMNVAQMLAHCSVTYDYIFTEKYPKPNFVNRLILKTFVKGIVVSEKTYKKNSPTAPAFKIVDQRVFEDEKQKLINSIKKVAELGEKHFDGKESHSFGPLTKNEWNNMFYKHLNYHLSQFGA